VYVTNDDVPSFPLQMEYNRYIFYYYLTIEEGCLGVTLQMCIQEVLGSNLGQGTSYPDWGFARFTSLRLGNYWDSMSIASPLFRSRPL
jgi:hypothetical protein